MAQLAVFEHLKAKKKKKNSARVFEGGIPGVHIRILGHYLPHQSVVIVGFDLTGVDQFPLERTEARPFVDAVTVREHSAMGQVPPARLEDGETWRSERDTPQTGPGREVIKGSGAYLRGAPGPVCPAGEGASPTLEETVVNAPRFNVRDEAAAGELLPGFSGSATPEMA